MYARLPPSSKNARTACQRKCGTVASSPDVNRGPPPYTCANSAELVIACARSTAPLGAGPTNPAVLASRASIVPDLILIYPAVATLGSAALGAAAGLRARTIHSAISRLGT